MAENRTSALASGVEVLPLQHCTHYCGAWQSVHLKLLLIIFIQWSDQKTSSKYLWECDALLQITRHQFMAVKVSTNWVRIFVSMLIICCRMSWNVIVMTNCHRWVSCRLARITSEWENDWLVLISSSRALKQPSTFRISGIVVKNFNVLSLIFE